MKPTRIDVPSEVEVEQQVVNDMFKELEDSCRHQQDNGHNPSEHQDLLLDSGGDELVIFDGTHMNDDIDDHQKQQLHQHKLPLTREEEGALQLEPQVEPGGLDAIFQKIQETTQQHSQQPQLQSQSQQQQVLLHEHEHKQRNSYDDCDNTVNGNCIIGIGDWN